MSLHTIETISSDRFPDSSIGQFSFLILFSSSMWWKSCWRSAAAPSLSSRTQPSRFTNKISLKNIAKEEIILVEMMSELLTASPASDSLFIDSHAPCFWMTSIILPSTHVDPLEPGSLHITGFDIKIHAMHKEEAVTMKHVRRLA